ncbi:hypothetical protein ES332_D01G164700v1 [Gossypium tomentosum]|uniref:Uncharacterized protein n=1 Tax=Gossypium tomentosum TaxID=34277 RepID=A0A5D2M9R0_GOSTO|nr:hypothetical protein ES332_D01G164700v1 [Gossypium tomentosum]
MRLLGPKVEIREPHTPFRSDFRRPKKISGNGGLRRFQVQCTEARGVEACVAVYVRLLLWWLALGLRELRRLVRLSGFGFVGPITQLG